jgi:hypothetical protein
VVVPAWIEVDLATMPQTALREKVGRYVAYVGARAWAGVHPAAPILLVVTTSTQRAGNFLAGAGEVLRSAVGWRPAEIEEAERLLVAVCPWVHDLARAASTACWQLGGPVRLTDLLAGRAAAIAAAEEAYAVLEEQQRHDDTIGVLERVLTSGLAGQRFGRHAAAVLEHLAPPGAERLYAGDRELAELLIAWGHARRHTRWPHHDSRPLSELLEQRHARLHRGQVRALLAADEHQAADEPWLSAAVVRAAAGELLTTEQADRLAGPAGPHARARLQQRLLAGYQRDRDAEAQAVYAALGWRERRRTNPATIAAGHDDARLLICDHCRIVQDRATDALPGADVGQPRSRGV